MQSPPARRMAAERGMLARSSARLKSLLAMAKKSWGAISLTAGPRTHGFSPIPLIAFLVFLLSRPYRGIVQDAYLYMGRALADLDPDGVGRDLMFVHDGQFGFSLFRFMARGMVAFFGPAAAAETLAIMAALAWFFGIRAFARIFVSGATVWMAVIFAALLPVSYGAPYPFGFAELLAIPRPFAEAFVLAGLAALAARRDAVSLCCFIAAALLHPLMALPGFGVFLVILGLEDKRWFLFCAFAGALVIVAGALGLPPLNRLFTAIEPSLRGFHEQRSPFLFPSHWPIESFPPLIVQAATIAIAAYFQQGRGRRILAAIVLVGLGGIAIAAIFGDCLSSLLIVQAQPWRTAWLMSATGAIALGVCAVELWPRGPSSRLVMALLGLCWSFNTQFAVAGPAAILALLLHFRAARFAPFIKPPLAVGVWIFTIVVGAIWQLRLFAYPWQFALASPAGYGDPAYVLVKGFLALPLCGLAAYFAIVRPRVSPLLQTGFTVLLLAAVVPFWDRRPQAQRMLEQIHAPTEILHLIDQQKGEVLWIDGSAEAWFFLGRPQWSSRLQGTPTIFSDTLASEWRSRTQFLMDLRLADQKSFARWSAPKNADLPRLSQEGMRALCARNDAPAWIIAPLEQGKTPPAGIAMTLWRLPEPQFQLSKADDDYTWLKIDAFGVIACGNRPINKVLP